MKKSLIILPLFALSLAACTTSGGGSKKKKSSTPTSSKSGPTAQSDTGTPQGNDEYQGYKKLKKAPENGKEYIYGIYQGNLDEYIFLNGDNHREEKDGVMKEYPYYLTTTQDVSKAVKVVCNYFDDTEFSIQIVGGGEFTKYDGKYLELYDGLKDDGKTKITSLRADVNPVHWKFMESYDYKGTTLELNTNIQMLQSEDYPEQPVTMATYEEYETFSACTPNHFADNFLSHLWEKM